MHVLIIGRELRVLREWEGLMIGGPDDASGESHPAGGEINLAREASFRLGAVRVDPPTCLVSWRQTEVRLEPRVMKVLVALGRAAGGILTRDDLIDRCWSGRLVSDDAVHRCIGALRKAAATFETAPFAIETIPRVGYRLLETASPEPVDGPGSGAGPETAEPAATSHHSPARPPRMGARLLATAVVVAAIVAVGSYLLFESTPPSMNDVQVTEPSKPSLGVVPFANLSADGEHEPFVDGLTEELVTKLGSVGGINVPGRASSFQVKGKALSAPEIGKILNVRYVLEGAVQREGDDVRVTAQLTDTETGYQVWSQVFDRTTQTVLAMQSEIARAVILSIPSLIGAEAQPQPYVDPRAHELFLTGLGHLRARYFDAGWPQAHEAFMAAVELDPDYAAANAYLAITISELRPANAERRARDVLAVAIMNAPGSAPVLFAEGWTAAAFGLGGNGPDLEAARRFFDRSLEIDPTNSEALRARARIEADPAKKLDLLGRATKIDPLFYAVRLDLATELAGRGRVQEAFREFDTLYSLEPQRGIRGAIELARAGSDVEALGRYAFGAIGPDIVTRPDRLLIAGLLADFGAVDEARFLYAYPTADPLLFLPKRREVYLAWLDGDAEASHRQMAGADYSRIESSSVFGAAVALFASKPDDAIALVLAAYPDMPSWDETRLAAVQSLPEVIGAHVYAMALRRTGDLTGARRVLMALVPAVHRIYPGEMRAQNRYLGLAVLYAQAGETGRAMDELERARAAGWRYPRTYAWVNYGPSPPIDAENGYLAPLRDVPEFQRIMREIRAENAAALDRFEQTYRVLSRIRALMAAQQSLAPGVSNPSD